MGFNKFAFNLELRFNKKAFLISALSCALISVQVQAQAQSQPQYSNKSAANSNHLMSNEHIIIAPQCLLKNSNGDYQKNSERNYQALASNKSFVLIRANDQAIENLIAAKNNHKTLCGGFMDMSQEWSSANASSTKDAQFFLNLHSNSSKPVLNAKNLNKNSNELKHAAQVALLFKQINPQNMWNYLTKLTSFNDRHANSADGVKAAEWIKNEIETIAKNNHRNDVTAYLLDTGSYKQASVVVKVGNGNSPATVIGAHMDTVKGYFSNMPGADDDGSGSATVLETARTVLSSGMTFKNPLYFIWYAAEEEGLVGSKKVVADFKQKNIPVAQVLHFDLTGYAHNNEPTMWLIDDYTNKDLTEFLSKLITAYVKQPIKHTRCGYACSDHASWTKAGYAAAIPAESAYEDTNPNIHSTNDTQAHLSLTHMTDYLKLALAFAVEATEPTE